jgi:glutathione S-transferase
VSSAKGGGSGAAADIAVTYALLPARGSGGISLGRAEQAYQTRTTGRDGYQRTPQTCRATREWLAEAPGR